MAETVTVTRDELLSAAMRNPEDFGLPTVKPPELKDFLSVPAQAPPSVPGSAAPPGQAPPAESAKPEEAPGLAKIQIGGREVEVPAAIAEAHQAEIERQKKEQEVQLHRERQQAQASQRLLREAQRQLEALSAANEKPQTPAQVVQIEKIRASLAALDAEYGANGALMKGLQPLVELQEEQVKQQDRIIAALQAEQAEREWTRDLQQRNMDALVYIQNDLASSPVKDYGVNLLMAIRARQNELEAQGHRPEEIYNQAFEEELYAYYKGEALKKFQSAPPKEPIAAAAPNRSAATIVVPAGAARNFAAGASAAAQGAGATYRVLSGNDPLGRVLAS